MERLKSLLATVAPWIGTALGGPLGGAAAGALVKALGLPEGSEKDMNVVQKAVLGASPELMLAIKKQDQDFQLQMETLGFTHIEKLEALAVGDRDSARKREIEVKDHTNRNLAYTYTVGYFGVVAIVIFNGIPEEVKELVFTLLGIMSGALMAINTYYFGSSAGSDAKNKTISSVLGRKGGQDGSST